MNRLEYYKLRNIPENRDLSEYEFQMKYIEKKRKVNFKQTNKIKDIKDFKEKVLRVKHIAEKKIVKW